MPEMHQGGHGCKNSNIEGCIEQDEVEAMDPHPQPKTE